MREPDWEALADVQFVLYNRVANQLNEALSGIALSDMPEASKDQPGYWKDRATTRVLNVLNLFTAWTWLIRFKMGKKSTTARNMWSIPAAGSSLSRKGMKTFASNQPATSSRTARAISSLPAGKK